MGDGDRVIVFAKVGRVVLGMMEVELALVDGEERVLWIWLCLTEVQVR